MLRRHDTRYEEDGGPARRQDPTGLGLAIVDQQVTLHGGELVLSESHLGGLAVHVRLPGTAET
jgi:signal transduction histidine kinase